MSKDRRRPENGNKSRRAFNSRAGKTDRRNLMHPQRGGIRL